MPRMTFVPITWASTIKGLLYVLVMSVLLYGLVNSTLRHVHMTEARLQLLFASVNDLIHIFEISDEGVPGQFLRSNEAAARQLGHSEGELQSMSPQDIVEAPRRPEALKHMERLWRDGRAIFETVYVTRDGSGIPVEVSAQAVRIGGKLIGVSIARDLTERRRQEEERRTADLRAEREKHRFYRETLLAVTNGKFCLGEHDEVDEWLPRADLRVEVPDPEGLHRARHEARRFCINAGMTTERADEFELAVGEALGNAVKHAGGGTLCASVEGESVKIAIEDRGPGIDTFTIPKMALLAGFTTKASMGLGYTMMLNASDAVKLATGSWGTTVVLEKFTTARADSEEAFAAVSAMHLLE